jgi:type IV pilus assembly PilN-like protein
VSLLWPDQLGVALYPDRLLLADQLAAEKPSVRDAAAATRENARMAVSSGEPQALASELKHANEILLQLALPWGELFASAESAGIPDVALLSIESDTDKRRVTISGEAKNLESILAYLRYLEARPALADVYLQSHQLQKKDPQHPARFALSAERPAGKDIRRRQGADAGPGAWRISCTQG